MKLYLVVLTDGKSLGRIIPVASPTFTIGRDAACQLRPASTLISKRHCVLMVQETGAFVRDFDSTNGTFVNDTRIETETPLRQDDVLRVGPLAFRVVLETSQSPFTATPSPEDLAAEILAAEDTARDAAATSETMSLRSDAEPTDVEVPLPSPRQTAQEAAEAILANFKRSKRRPSSR